MRYILDGLLNKNVIVYTKSGLVLEGFVFNIMDGFLLMKEKQSEFENAVISVDDISVVRAKPLGDNIPETKPACETEWVLAHEANQQDFEAWHGGAQPRQFYPAKEEVEPPASPVQLAAKVSKRPNDFSTILPTVPGQNPYKPPSFVRETDRSEK